MESQRLACFVILLGSILSSTSALRCEYMLDNGATTSHFASPSVGDTLARLLCEDGRRFAEVAPQAAQLGSGSRVAWLAESKAARPEVGSVAWCVHFAMALICVSCAALAAGLTMGMMSLEPMDMELLMTTEEEHCESEEELEDLREEKGYAKKILPLISDHHKLLVTLLLMNATANEALPIFLDSLVPSWAAVMISVTVVLILGEIIPSAVFTGPNQLKIAARFAGVAACCQRLLFVIAVPIARLLDCVLGTENRGRHTRAEIKALLNLHCRDGAEGQTPIMPEVKEIMFGAMDLKKMHVQDMMVPLDDANMLPMDTKLDIDAMAKLISYGHSRLPVYDGHPHNIRGLLMVKNLIVLNPDDARSVNTLTLRKPLVVGLDEPVMDLLQKFGKGKSHMALVTDDPKKVTQAWKKNVPVPASVKMAGIVTMEDVIEDLLRREILDEYDPETGVRNRLADVAFQLKRMDRVREISKVAKTMPEGRRRTLTRRRSSVSSLATPFLPQRSRESSNN